MDDSATAYLIVSMLLGGAAGSLGFAATTEEELGWRMYLGALCGTSVVAAIQLIARSIVLLLATS